MPTQLTNLVVLDLSKNTRIINLNQYQLVNLQAKAAKAANSKYLAELSS